MNIMHNKTEKFVMQLLHVRCMENDENTAKHSSIS